MLSKYKNHKKVIVVCHGMIMEILRNRYSIDVNRKKEIKFGEILEL